MASTDTFEDVQKISGLLLDPSRAEPASRPLGTTRLMNLNIPIYYLPDEADTRHRKAVMLVLTSCARVVDSRTSSYQTFILSYMGLMFPDLATSFVSARMSDYDVQPFPPEFVDAAYESVTAYMGESPDTDPMITYPAGLPQAGLIPVTAELVSCGSVEALYAYGSMLLFLSAKQITRENRISVTQKRPTAVIKKLRIDSQAHILTGEGRIVDECHTLINGAWARSTQPRILTIQHVAAMRAAPDRSIAKDVVMITFNLMQWAQAQSVFYIHQLLETHPWVARRPPLVASFKAYARSVQKLHEEPAWFRPYYKLAYQDATDLFRRRDIDPLIAVSIYWARQSSETIGQFAVAAGHDYAVSDFVNEARKRNIEVKEITSQNVVSVTQ